MTAEHILVLHDLLGREGCGREAAAVQTGWLSMCQVRQWLEWRNCGFQPEALLVAELSMRCNELGFGTSGEGNVQLPCIWERQHCRNILPP